MKLSDFAYHLPEHLIARQPAPQRSASRLMAVNCTSGEITHRRFGALPELLRESDLLVFNDTRVIPARLYGRKPSGGQVEVLLERVLDEGESGGEGKESMAGGENGEGESNRGARVLAQLRVSKKPAAGGELLFTLPKHSQPLSVKVIKREGDFFVLQFPARPTLKQVLDAIGHTPLPPYISRPDSPQDALRYQTVYAAKDGAVAAPTAGLHFDDDLLHNLKQRGIASTFLTLHIGAGTFQPVRVSNVEQHQMHAELMQLDEQVCQQVAACKAAGGRVVAVGTTAVRALETAAQLSVSQASAKTAAQLSASQPSVSQDSAKTEPHHIQLTPYHGDTNIFIYPGFKFQAVDALITNFHLPESTLLMLVSAFAGVDLLREAYQQAITQEYRFYSYGDSMMLYRY
ncbi:MAG: tRNA preQ1(34) S-adenosylmethionine ribosyltransferase-isomerase QueA [Pseudohongiellaceae bacterium]